MLEEHLEIYNYHIGFSTRFYSGTLLYIKEIPNYRTYPTNRLVQFVIEHDLATMNATFKHQIREVHYGPL